MELDLPKDPREHFYDDDILSIIEQAVNAYNDLNDNIPTFITSKKNTSTLHISKDAPIYGVA